MYKPRILVPASHNADQPPEKFHFNCAYIRSIEEAGGNAIGVMRPSNDDLDELLVLADGIYLMGGNDIDPKEYGEPDRHCVMCEPERDRVEMHLIKRAIEQQIPIFTICRGFQVLNVTQGGTLYQDVMKEMPGAIQHSYHTNENGETLPRNLRPHGVSITEGTLLHRIAGNSHMDVNSLHHQGIKKLGDNLRVTAVAPDGLIEGIEIEGHPFSLAIEWHPEELHDSVSEKMFTSFIDACRNYHETKNRS